MNDTTQKSGAGRAVLKFIRKNAVFFIALTIAAITCIIVPPDKKYADYFDFKTLTSLFCMLLVVCALRNIKFFRILARRILRVFKSARSVITMLVAITYFASMLIANDMALITFLPLAIIVLDAADLHRYTAFTFIIMTIAANLGGMLTPFGNPQNLYLYNYFNIPTGKFFATMAPPFAVSLALIFACCMFVKPVPLTVAEEQEDKLNIPRAIVYALFFVYALLIVFRVVPYLTGLLMIPVFLFLDRKALRQVDYILLLTFCMFFIFAGNLARIKPVAEFLTSMAEKNTLLTAVLSCQVISNVPSSVLLAPFASDYRHLLVAVNIGGCGTLVSSLASLITFRTYVSGNPGKTGKFLLLFHAMNLSFLLILTVFCYFVV